MSSSETPTVCPQDAKSTTSRSRLNGNFLKRTREQSSDSTCDTVDEVRPKTRRVNPERLAARLDPRLVAEMDAFIVPGAKMPNFTIRKDFQERYCVDRRHIYDYFHSRGLRVAKEDKHNNLLRGRLLKARSSTTSEDDKVSYKQQEEKPKRTRPRDGAQIGNVKSKRHRIISSPPGSSKLQSNSQSPSLSPTSGGSEGLTSSNESPVPEFTLTDEIPDSVSISVRAYTDADTMNLTFDNLYSFYGLSQISSEAILPIPSNILGAHGFSSLGEEYSPFVHEEHLDYYEPRFFVHDNSLVPFVEGLRAQDKLAELHLMTGTNAGCTLGGSLEVSHRPSRCQDATTTDYIARDDDVDFSRWLLAIGTQDESPGIQTESTVKDLVHAVADRGADLSFDQCGTKVTMQQLTNFPSGRASCTGGHYVKTEDSIVL